MARQEIDREDAPEGRPAPQARSLLPAGGLLAVVVGLMILGAVLHARVPTRTIVPPEPEAGIEEPLPAASDLPPVLPDPEPAPDPEPPARSGSWTLQLAAVCEPASIARIRAQAQAMPGLAVRPVTVKGRPCQALTWGTFGSRDEARLAQVPPAVAKLGTPTPKELR